MKESIVTVFLAAGCVVLAAAAGVGIYQKDRTAPVINYDKNETILYVEGESQETLLKGVGATDERDGDVTDTLRVDKIYRSGENGAVVVYTAKDHANNIGKIKRKINYKATEIEADQENEEKNGIQNVLNKPQITLLQNEVTLKKGEGFNLMRYVESAIDVDGSDLSRSLHASGEYDTNSPGEYMIRVWAINAEGTVSNIESFLLIVEE